MNPCYLTEIGDHNVEDAFNGTNYAIQCVGNGPIKIGFTNRGVQSRLSYLRAASPYELEVLAEWPATWKHEQRLHRLLELYRLRREWYHPVTPVLEAIRAEQTASTSREPARAAFVEYWKEPWCARTAWLDARLAKPAPAPQTEAAA